MTDKVIKKYIEKMAYSSDYARLEDGRLVVNMVAGPEIQVILTDSSIYRIIARSLVFVPQDQRAGVERTINRINSKIDATSFYCDTDGEIICRSHLNKRGADACALSMSIKAVNIRLMRHLGDIIKVAEEQSEAQEYKILEEGEEEIK